jgi:phosphatidylserine/phosphatidylglycerophosphate/cardiolipin synthase-like enzyme
MIQSFNRSFCLWLVYGLWVLNSCSSSRSVEMSSHLKDTTDRSARVLFHPYDPTLETISIELLAAEQNIDIAMYNLDVTDGSPVIRTIKSDVFQQKMRDQGLRVRLIFEGYGDAADVRARSEALEQLGIDVRWLKGGKKVHHKFAVIDSDRDRATVISGSANWSLSSQRNYDENILFFPNNISYASDFQSEFNLLWSMSEEFGNVLFSDPLQVTPSDDIPGLSVVFNTSNYVVQNGQLRKSNDLKGWELTRSIVKSIDEAKHTIRIASTRLVLRPIYDALVEAAGRGVKIDLLINQDQYAPSYIRNRWKLNQCGDKYSEECSVSQVLGYHIQNEDFAGRDNVKVRVKFFSLSLRSTLSKQMHSKYIIVDDARVLTGSFNWSVSSEWEHLENVQIIDASTYSTVVNDFIKNHEVIFEQGRQETAPYLERLNKAASSGQKTDCRFAPMALSYSEIDQIVDLPSKYRKKFSDICEN